MFLFHASSAVSSGFRLKRVELSASLDASWNLDDDANALAGALIASLPTTLVAALLDMMYVGVVSN
jgi:hypothetical protein